MTMGLFGKPGKHEEIKPDPDDQYWDWLAHSSRFDEKLAKVQRAVGANRAADESQERARMHRDEMKRMR